MGNEKKTHIFRVGDLLCIFLVLLFAAALLVFPRGIGDAARVEITCGDGESVFLPLDEDAERPIEGNGYALTVVVANGEVFVKDADCPDRVCVRTGKIKKTGDVIVCAPARIVVRIVGGGGADADLVAG